MHTCEAPTALLVMDFQTAFPDLFDDPSGVVDRAAAVLGATRDAGAGWSRAPTTPRCAEHLGGGQRRSSAGVPAARRAFTVPRPR